MFELALRILVLIAAIQQLLFPFFVNPFAGGENPVRFGTPSQIEPAGYAFSIWGPIYLLALGYGVWQLTAVRYRGATLKIAPFALVLYFGSSAWLYAAKHGPLIATMPILGVMAISATLSLLISLQYIPRTGWSWWAVVLPFALYAGWTVCAAFVNVAEVAPACGFNRFGLSVPGYALLSLTILGLVAMILLRLTQGNLPFAATIIWALVAIAVAGVGRGADRSVVLTSVICAVLIAVVSLTTRIFSRQA